ncbi:phosphoribosylformylglycinamidine synthase [Alkalidesulfovibrio alkalitolerans DSM 16529]|uniref:Phosphoribosylformylglycinamidine synthase n=1 Tax=Alkalidesulfovibrio alkalitolerans DSM 16529 TaxID=1121439 RepID=S7T283_9BACT|nr:phosphoribosylformylglycinamidine synthase subunit PurQ [Alkalidesulfovibrio alkalitolerans]EPR30691.1 phosphoribosylformylglycinamidine synthase [Alkalidesulfovibrio alkalitolerans DSM 16529]
MQAVNTLVITGHGTNCHKESAHAARLAGADRADVVFFSDLRAGRVKLADYNLLIFPGGFLDGDDLGAAQAAALRWRYMADAEGRPLVEDLKSFFDDGGLILGICNGFQLLVKLGLLPAIGGDYFQRTASLSNNDSARFEDRWVWLAANQKSPCVFTKGLDRLYLPVRHGEGKLVFEDDAAMRAAMGANLHALSYVHPETGLPTEEYPFNPNGSPHGIAGLTDPSGRILGLMPHPEAFNHPTNHPNWTRGASDPLGVSLIEGGVRFLKDG